MFLFGTNVSSLKDFTIRENPNKPNCFQYLSIRNYNVVDCSGMIWIDCSPSENEDILNERKGGK